MWNDCSEDVGAFAKLNNMEKNDIKGVTWTQLVTSLIIFSTWMLCQSNTALDGKKSIYWSTEVISNTIGTVFILNFILFVPVRY